MKSHEYANRTCISIPKGAPLEKYGFDEVIPSRLRQCKRTYPIDIHTHPGGIPGRIIHVRSITLRIVKGPGARTSWKRNDIITIIDPEHSAFVNLRREVEFRRQT